MEKKIMDQEEYEEYLNEKFENDEHIKEQDGIELHISIYSDGFKVCHNNKSFICYNADQFISYLKTLNVSEEQLLEVIECVREDCKDNGFDFSPKLD